MWIVIIIFSILIVLAVSVIIRGTSVFDDIFGCMLSTVTLFLKICGTIVGGGIGVFVASVVVDRVVYDGFISGLDLFAGGPLGIVLIIVGLVAGSIVGWSLTSSIFP